VGITNPATIIRALIVSIGPLMAKNSQKSYKEIKNNKNMTPSQG
jgi:hypothetical protein